MTGPAPVQGPKPAMTTDDAPAGTGGPAEVEVCQHCRQLRRRSALAPVPGGWQCREPCRNPGGRPPVGPPVLIRMPQHLRDAVEALARPGEKLAATARRLLTAAVDTASQAGQQETRPPRRPAPAADPAAAPGSARALVGWLAAEDERLSRELDDPDEHPGPGAGGLQQSLALVLAHIEESYPGAAADEAPAPRPAPGSCPDCGGPRELSLGNVAMCGRCGAIFDMAATPEATAADVEPVVRHASQRTQIEGPRGVLVQTWRGLAIVGPVHTDKGVREIRAEIERESEDRTPWTVLGQVRMITKARLPWERSKWGS